MLGRNPTDSLYSVTNHLQAHVTQVIPINKLSDTIGPSFRQYVDYAKFTQLTSDQSGQCGHCTQVVRYRPGHAGASGTQTTVRWVSSSLTNDLQLFPSLEIIPI